MLRAILLLQSCWEKQLGSLSSVSRVKEQALGTQSVVGGNLTPRPCSMAAEAGGILDIRNIIGIPNFDDTDATWESWRAKFEACADMAGMGAHLDVAAEQTAFIKHDGPDAPVGEWNSSRLAYHQV